MNFPRPQIFENARVLLAEITSAPGLNFSLAAAYMQSFCEAKPELRQRYNIQRFVRYAGLGEEKILKDFVEDARQNGRPTVLAMTIYFWNRKITQSIIRELKAQWPDLIVVVGGNDIESHGAEAFADDLNVDYICVGEGEQVLADLLSEIGEAEKVHGLPDRFRYAKGQIDPLAQIPSPFLTGTITPDEIAAASMIIYETNRGCPFKCSFCYWGGAVGSKVRRFDKERVRAEIRHLLRHMTTGATLFLADANFGMHQADIEFAELLGSEAKAVDKRFLLFVNWAKNTTQRVMTAARILFENDLIGAVTLSAQSLDPETLAAAGRDNIPYKQYLEIHDVFRKAGIPTYTELILGLPPESPETFYCGIQKVLEGGGHPVIYPLLLLKNTELHQQTSRQKWDLQVRKLPYQHVGSGGGRVETVVGHRNLSASEWVNAMQFGLVMALFHHVLARETIRTACGAARINTVVGLQKLQAALSEGKLALPGRTAEIIKNHERSLLNPDQFDKALVLSRTGENAIPDHLHYQAATIEIFDHFRSDPGLLTSLLDSVSEIIQGKRLPDTSAPHLSDRAWVSWLTRETKQVDRDPSKVPRDALMLGVYHGAVSRYLLSEEAPT